MPHDALSLGPLRLRPNNGGGGWPRAIEVAAGGATELHLEWSSGIPAGARGDALLASGERLPWGVRVTVVAHLPTRRPASAAVAARQLQAALARGIAQRLVFALNRPPGGLAHAQRESARRTLRQLAGGRPDEPSDELASARAGVLSGAPAAVEPLAAHSDDEAAAAAAAAAATAGTAVAAGTGTGTATAAPGPDWASLKELAEHILVGPRLGVAG